MPKRVSNAGIAGREIGRFGGFSRAGQEFTAEITSHTAGYAPHLGELVAAEISSASSVLGRITRFFPAQRDGNSGGGGDLFDAHRYSVNVTLLGTLTSNQGDFVYGPGVRRLPNPGAKVHTLSQDALRFVCSLGQGEKRAIPIGHYALGESVDATVPVLFDIGALVGRKTYVFARAGYGKSNLVKLLLARLYQEKQQAGAVVFDPEGEYAFRDKRGRPGLADVPHLADNLVVYTNRKIAPPYSRWVAGETRLNVADIRPADIVKQCLPEGKQEAVFANILRGLSQESWRELVALLKQHGYKASDEAIQQITGYDNDKSGVVIAAIKNNLVPVVKSLHSDSSDMIRGVRSHVAAGRIVIVDLSLVGSSDSYKMSGLILHDIFQHNQERFIEGSEGSLLPVIAVIEEAQAVLPRGVPETSPYMAWVKEGRKFLLGAILVTQQPGAIAQELLSQGDNFFAFHLLSSGDLSSLKEHNAHYSDDILACILNEPIKGNAYFWSAPDQPFTLPCRIHDFEMWVTNLRAGAVAHEAPAETAAELGRKEDALHLSQLDAVVKREIERNPAIALWSVAGEDGEPRPGLAAVKPWNLYFAVASTLAEENPSLAHQYVRVLQGKPVLDERACLESLGRMGVMAAKAGEVEDGTVYFLLNAEALSLPAGRIRQSPKRLRIPEYVDARIPFERTAHAAGF